MPSTMLDQKTDSHSSSGRTTVAPSRPVAPDPRPGSAAQTTVLPRRPSSGSTPPVPRTVARVARQDLFVMGGAALSAACTTLLLFGRLTSLSGKFGFLVVWFLMFLFTYALLVSLTEDRPVVVDKVMGALLTASAVTAGVVLMSVVIFTLWRGGGALVKTNLYLEDMSVTGPLDPLTKGGVLHAIVGTLVIIGISLAITVPLGITCAVFLNETGGRTRSLVRTVVTAMTALPSILAGLFLFATWVLLLGFQRSGLAAALAVSIMMLPIIIRSSEVVLRLVPGNLREASDATGAPHWRTVWCVVLPTARSGLVNSVILGVARGVGETAPILLVSGLTKTMNVNPRENAMMSLPLAVFDFVRSGQPTLIKRGFATAAVLMVLVLLLFTVARIFGGKPPGHLSKRQARSGAARSARDLRRIESRLEGSAS